MIGIRLRAALAAAIVAWSVCIAPAAIASPALTTIQDTLYQADGAPFNGVLIISWQSFLAADGSNIATQTLTTPVALGRLRVRLVPTTNAQTPMTYTVKYYSDGKNGAMENWAVPPSAQPVRLQSIRVAQAGGLVTPPSLAATIPISSVTGLAAELGLRPSLGPAFTVSRVAVINSSGTIDGAAGFTGDCVHVDGSSGPCGGGGGAAPLFADNETPLGAVNGTNVSFSLANAPSPASSLSLFLNGLLLRPLADYALINATIALAAGATPQPGAVLVASYRYAGNLAGVAFVDLETPSGTIDGTNRAFTLANTPFPAASLAVYRNGLRMSPSVDFSLSGAVLTFGAASAPQPGDALAVSYRLAR